MIATASSPVGSTFWTHLQYVCELLKLAVIAGILTAAMTMQYLYGELPCPLCLLQRFAMFGICFGAMLNLRQGFSNRSTGYSLLFTIVLLVISVRQTLLDICPRPGHEYVGSAIFGLHMPVWSVLIALALLVAHAVMLIFPDGRATPATSAVSAVPTIAKLGAAVSAYVVALCIINVISVAIQCGTGECHTTGYRLLG
jgi:disulfide bond formation protein DsbB